MSRSTFAFFRGVSWSVPQEPSKFSTPESSRVAVIGDPHPENVGTFVTGAGIHVVDFNDFDQADFGPYIDDVRRLAVSLWITADMGDIHKKQRALMVGEMVAGYVAELRRQVEGKSPFSLRVESAFGGDLQDILVRPNDEDSAAGMAASADEERLVRAILETYPATLHAPRAFGSGMFVAKKIVRRHSGVGSYPALRYRVIIEGKSTDSNDDKILELKESSGEPAERLVAIQREFQEFPDDDPFLGWGRASGHEFRVREVSQDQRRLTVERIVKQVKSPRWKKRNFKDFSEDLGRLLARGHARARGSDGRPGLGIISAAVGAAEGLEVETIEFAGRVAAQTESDLARFRELLKTQGPLLGWQR